MQYNLFLDDDRSPQAVTWVELPLVEWVIVRNYDNFVRIITDFELPLRISFDHDLADKHYWEFHRAKETDGIIHYENLVEKTGYHCAKWLVNYCLDRKLPLPEYYIHSWNDIGAANIKSLLESYKKFYGSNQR